MPLENGVEVPSLLAAHESKPTKMKAWWPLLGLAWLCGMLGGITLGLVLLAQSLAHAHLCGRLLCAAAQGNFVRPNTIKSLVCA